MSKAELITWIASLPDDSPELDRVAEIQRGGPDAGEVEAEPFLSLKAVAAKVNKHYVWLSRLNVPEICGEYLAGRRAYRLSTVLEYLKSDQCRDRIAQLREERKAREGRAA